MNLIGLKKALLRLVEANGMRWYEHALRWDSNHVLRRALDFELEEKGVDNCGWHGEGWWKNTLN